MYGDMRLNCICETENQYNYSQFDIRYYSGDLFIIPRLSGVISPTNLVLSMGKSMCVVREC